mmetsp:Transcript_6084/g.10616  ORF Transcript_6084/g.10616 Transcript_6084/m.10616 type:complete len:98 (+) Transcript_6084:191-484(+)
MIIDAKTVIVTLIIVAVAFVAGLRLVRSFALSIAQENLDANTAMDLKIEEQRQREERDADTAAKAAFAKVKPLLTVPKGAAAKKEAATMGSSSSEEV